MKFIPFFVLFILSISFVSAAEISVLQENYLAGETVQVYVNASSLASSDIALYDVNNNPKQIAPLFTEYRDGYFFVYFHLFENYLEGKYTLEIQDAKDTFSIIPPNGQAVLQIKPGFILLDSQDDTFSFELSDVGDSSSTLSILESNAVLSARKNQLSIGPGEQKNNYVDYLYYRISLDLFMNISYDDQYYILPVLYSDLVVEEEVVEEEESEEELVEEVVVSESSFALLVSEGTVVLTLEPDQSKYGDLKVQNLLEESLILEYSLTGDLDGIVTLNESRVTLAAGEIYSQRVWFNPQNNSRVGVYSGDIVLTDGSSSESISVSLDVAEVVADEDVNQSSGSFPFVSDGTLVPKESNTSLYAVAVFMILLLVALIVLVVLKLRQKDEKKFHEYIEGTKKRK
ncbi:MAG: hypothetical protein QT08_C0013G0020 [archaeon GW2011_AR17]|nr:MAG: hypothetical protein QT08_C0013G0020 [archaeon GW2011_AR17]MBS3153863.1 hypothetical protein [Candidatus Woesearchaeota archaeon]HIH15464.1 hypothetical protein [Nanoarchaeota archaeon]